MGYRIEYDKLGKLPQPARKHRKGVFAVILVLLLVCGAIAVKSAGLDWVKEFLIPGDPEITAAALDTLVEDLRSGEGLAEAVRAFCQEIIDNAQSQ